MAPAFAQENSPDALIKSVTDDVLTIVSQDKDIQSGKTKKVIELVDAKVLPHFNFPRMTALAMGRDWHKATPEQKKQLSEEFKTLLVRTYSNALTTYKNQTVRLQADQHAGRRDRRAGQDRRSSSRAASRFSSITAWRSTAGGWKVYDVIVAGVSLVTNYRGSFNQEVRSNGVDGPDQDARRPRTASIARPPTNDRTRTATGCASRRRW